MIPRLLLILALLVVAAARADLPDVSATAAKERFESGRVHFRAGRFDPAAELFLEAYATFADPAYLFNVALCYERSGRWGLAVMYYDRFLAVAPGSAATAEVETRRTAAEAARRAEQSWVTVTTTPPGAAVRIASAGGDVTCESPCRQAVDPGPVTVSARFGRAPGPVQERHATRPMGASDAWTVDLEAALGTLVVEGDDARVDGASVAAGEPLTVFAGEHTVQRGDGPTRTVAVTEGATVRVTAGARPPTAALRAAGWSLVGVGAATVVAGAVLAGLAQGDYDDGIALTGGPATDDARDSLDALRGSVSRYSLGADLSLGLGGAALVSGLTLLLWPDPEAP